MTKENGIEIIKLTNKTDLYKLLIGARYVDAGNTSRCFLLKDGKVLKIYKERKEKRNLFKKYNMLEHILLLSTLKNDSYIAPTSVYTYQNEVVAYTIEYHHANTLAKLNPNTKIEEVLKNLDKLIEDTYKIGDKKFRLYDLHDKNILFSLYFYIIDLDFGEIKDKSVEDINKYNIRDIIMLLMRVLFGIREYKLLNIYDLHLSKLYNQAIYDDYKNIYPFFESLKEAMKKDTLQVRDLKRSRLYTKEYNSYYKFPLG